MKRNKFSLSHFRLMSCTMGQLVPIGWFEVLPGDTVQQATSLLVRAAPLVAPPMHPVHVRVHHFYVPNRIMWQGTQTTGTVGSDSGFESFITGGPDGLDATAHPYVGVSTGFANNTLGDYLGLSTSTIGDAKINVSALPFRAYNMIWNEYFRDEDLDVVSAVSTLDGADSTTNTNVLNVRWQKDYFTTCRPWESKGPAINIFPPNPAVQAPLAMITGSTATTHATYPGAPAQAINTISTPPTQAFDATTDAAVAGTSWVASLSSASNMDINSLRRQFALQRFQEARARYGSRYVEYLRYLGIRSSDARLQRPEYLGGGTSTIQFSEVLQTGVTTSGTQGGIGSMFGHGISAHRSNRYRRFFEEHGIVMSLLSVRPITVYSQLNRRAWFRGMTGAGGAIVPVGVLGTREDYFQRELQNIGQQQVMQAEVEGAKGSVAVSFGFQDRYDEYRRMESQVTGQFRAPGALTTWHFARSFASAPTLNNTFVGCTPSVLPFADQAHDTLYVMANHSIQARRMVAKRGGSYVR